MRNCLSHWLKSTTHCLTCSTAETVFSYCDPLPDGIVATSSYIGSITLLESFCTDMSHE